MTATPPFGVRLKQRRAALDLTQEALAERVACAPQTIRKIESGERRPSRDMAERLAQVLELAPGERESFLREARAIVAPPPTPAAVAPLHEPSAPRVVLPKYTRPFVGRAADVRSLQALLEAPDCQLITVVGPGGIGKTRLMVEVASHARHAADGVVFVSLAAVTEPSHVASVIAEALGYTFHENEAPEIQLINYLREKQLWLLLDNMEQVLDASELLVTLLEDAPGLRCVVTSRERLNVQGEWVVELAGLSARAADAAQGPADAVALFVERARRVRTSFSLTEPDLQHVVRVCELVGGTPLAIELAASWVRMLSCAEIADEIQRNFDILSTSARDLPGRHQSLRAVFDHSWRLLSDDERRVLRQLTIFRGGFDRGAATEIAGASLAVLAALVDKSLLRRTADARYDLHSLVQQYAAERLAADVGEQTAAYERMARYFLRWLDERSFTIQGRNQAAAIKEIASEIDNLRVAWEWAAQHHRLADMAAAQGTLHWFFEFRTWFQEGEAIFRSAAAALQRGSGDPAVAAMLGHVRASQGYFAMRSGHLELARDILNQSLLLLREPANPALLAGPKVYLGVVAYQTGRYDEARTMLRDGLSVADPNGWIAALSLCFLGLVAHAAGDYAEARRLFREDLAVWRALDNARGMTLCLNFFSTTLFRLGEYDEAQSLLHESLELCAATGDRWGLGTALNHLGLVAQAQGEQQQAHYLFNESLALFREMGERWAVARTLNHLGTAAQRLGNLGDAKRSFVAALRTAVDANTTPDALNALTGLATVLAAEGSSERALELALQVVHHSASGNEARERAQQLAGELAPRFDAQRRAEIAAAAAAQSLTETAASLALAYHERALA